MTSFYGNGKLLLTAEYLVLDGAKALALPTKFGQSLTVKEIEEPLLVWDSYDHKSKKWLQAKFDLPKVRIISETFASTIEGGSDSLALRLRDILLKAKGLNPDFLSNENGYQVTTKLDFPRKWGLGSSATLINNIAQWAYVNAFDLQFNTFGGSGYDVACAQNDSPIIYQLKNNDPLIRTVKFNPAFKSQLYFVYLNKKQNSREGIKAYRKNNTDKEQFITEVSDITEQILHGKNIEEFKKLLKQHELVISKIIGQKPVQERLFPDYFGQTKSLGAWGGDFILATGNGDTPGYFRKKGFETVIRYEDMVNPTSILPKGRRQAVDND